MTPDTLAAGIAAGAVAVGAGGDLANGASIAAGDWADIEQRSARFAAALAAVRG